MTRAEAIKILSSRDGHGIPSGYNSGYAEAIEVAIEVLEAEPIKHGRWKVILSGDYAICTNCEHYWIPNGDQYDYHYCPNCGARMMDEVEE